MSKARLVITALFVDHQTPAEVAARYGVHRAWVYKLKARYEAEGEAALEPRSRRPKTTPRATPPATVDLVLRLRKQLAEAGLDAGADTIGWHLSHHHAAERCRGPRSTGSWSVPARSTPDPSKRPKSSYIRFEAEQPNESWQSDFTHYRLTDPDGRPRHGTSRSSAGSTTTPATPCTSPPTSGSPPRSCWPTFREAADLHGYPASTLTDNGMVYTARLAGGRGTRGRNAFEAELQPTRDRPEELPTQPPHHLRQGRTIPADPQEVAPCPSPTSRPRSPSSRPSSTPSSTSTTTAARTAPCAHRSTPAAAYAARPKATPGSDRTTDTHDRIRQDRINKAGTVTLRSPAACTTSASAEPTPEPTSSCSSKTSTSASSTPPPANSSASSPSTPAATTSPPARPTRTHPEMTTTDLRNRRSAVADVLRHHTGRADSVLVQDIGDRCLKTSATRMSQDIGDTVPGSMLGHVESPPGHHRRAHREPDPSPRSPPTTACTVLGLPAHGPLPRRGRGRVRAPLPAPARPPRPRHPPTTVELVLRAAQEADRRRPGRRRRHHRAGTSNTTTRSPVAGHHPPDPGPRRRWSPRTRRSDPSPPTSGSRPSSPTRPGSPTSPTTGSPARRPPRRRHRDHHLARRPLPLRPARHRPPPRSPPRSCSTTFTQTADQHGYPASTLTDNGMVYTVRLAGGRGGGTQRLEAELRRLGIVQKNSRPNHPTTCGKVERFQQTLKKWLRAQPDQPDHDRRAPDAARRLRRRVQPPPTAPLPAAPSHPGHRLHRHAQGHPRHDRDARHPRPGPPRPGQQDRHRHPAPQRPTAPHRHRPNLRRNPRPAPRPRPRHPHRRRRHRRTPPRTHPRPHPRLPTHRTTTRPHRKTATDLRFRRSVVRDVLRHHTGRADRI